ncbi:hypothetical protein HYPSUDRAFT_186828 [Hypholoma sublateritium FD-334 SS-4]|uniref:FAD/NAD(P)-binding domain-containing protein n=1 Tax=Hypholoma sublateritium (strain FD-334 SS-4) TaxID=945553 RepID=A0A0D2PPU1_HYPSF|nr:hypothetical protein HYPSUDRAFT_186828 [Hypholoma sublateritium FD-334 SS-4]
MHISSAIQNIASDYLSTSAKSLRTGAIWTLINPLRLAACIWSIWYVLVQVAIIYLFKPPPPPPNSSKELSNPRGRIAVIGAGVTGVSSAAHAIAHGFEVVIFEQTSESKLGGIWANVNATSGLQLNSLLYRFHPAVMWTRAFPLRDEVLGEIKRVWEEYHLEGRTRFDTKVTSVRKAAATERGDDPDRSRWVINDDTENVYDAVIVSIGTCGDPNWIKLPGMPEREEDKPKDIESAADAPETPSEDAPTPGTQPHSKEEYGGIILHSSQLDSPEFNLKGGERVVVIGSGASGVEAVETVLQKFGSVRDLQDGEEQKRGVEVFLIARNDKWIIPRNTVIDTAIAGQPFGREMPLSFIWEGFLRYWQYSGVEELVPANTGIYEGTPVVNDVFLDHVKNGRCRYIRGQPSRLTKSGVLVEARKSKPEGSGKNKNKKKKKARKASGAAVEDIAGGDERIIEADVIVLATGYKKPSMDFLPKDLFPEGYERPDLYLQNFSTEDWSILMTNSAYMNAIGTVGHFHIGIYTRILLTLLLDKTARPTPKDMKLWVDVLRFIKRGATGGALGFFTYMELTIWLLLFHILRPDRIRWLFFIMNGWGVYARE